MFVHNIYIYVCVCVCVNRSHTDKQILPGVCVCLCCTWTSLGWVGEVFLTTKLENWIEFGLPRIESRVNFSVDGIVGPICGRCSRGFSDFFQGYLFYTFLKLIVTILFLSPAPWLCGWNHGSLTHTTGCYAGCQLFSASERDRCQSSIVRNLGSYWFVYVIPL